ncbi:MAG: hypothetical protein NVS4B8_23570 [Herpetosiphon sp.]
MDVGVTSAFGTLLRRYRLAAGLTQEELAERAAVSRRSIGDMERGVARRPHKETIDMIATALGLLPPDRISFADAARRVVVQSIPDGHDPELARAPFVGRPRELALIERHLAGEGPPLLIFAGEPGIGKTRLLQAAMPRAVGYGLSMLDGGCQRRGGQLPFTPILDALQRAIRRESARQQQVKLQGCAWLVRLLPELGDGRLPPLPPWSLPPAQESRLINDAVVHFLANMAGPHGTLLILDDLQWAGTDALDLLALLARGAAEIPLRILAAYRETEVQPTDALAGVLADLSHAGLVARRQIEPLKAEEAAALLDRLLDRVEEPATVQRSGILERAGGVPYFLISCAEAVRDATSGHGQTATIPWNVQQSVRQRIAMLPEIAHDLLGTAAVIGRVVSPKQLIAVVERPESDVMIGCEVLTRAHLLQERNRADYQFAHDVIREVVEADLGPARRAILHRRVAQMLEQQGGELPVELLAYHYLRSTESAKAISFLEQAGDRAFARSAYRAADSYYRELGEHLDQHGQSEDRARVNEKRGAVLGAMGDYAAALEALEHAALSYTNTGNHSGVVSVTAKIAWVCFLTGRAAVGLARIQPLLKAQETREKDREQALLNAMLVQLLWSAQRYEECVAAAERALHMVGDDQHLAIAVKVRQGSCLVKLGQWERGRQVLVEAVRVAEATGDLEFLQRGLHLLGWTLLDGGEFVEAQACCERVLEIVERLGDPAIVANSMLALGQVLFLRGEWAKAGHLFAGAADLMASVQGSGLAPHPRLHLGLFHLATGDWTTAVRELQATIVMVHAANGNQRECVVVRAEALLAEHDLLAGRPAAAIARIGALRTVPKLSALQITRLLSLDAWAHLAVGDIIAAQALAAEASARASQQHYHLVLVDVLRVQALIALQRSCWDLAHQSLSAGLALTQHMAYPYGAARLQYVHGLLHLERHDPVAARERLIAARTTFCQLGARPDTEIVDRALAGMEQH